MGTKRKGKDPGAEARATPLDGEERLWVFSIPLPASDVPLAKQLTRAEQEVARLAARGDTNAEIAAARGSSVRTVANQLRSIYTKLSLASRSELAELLDRD